MKEAVYVGGGRGGQVHCSHEESQVTGKVLKS